MGLPSKSGVFCPSARAAPIDATNTKNTSARTIFKDIAGGTGNPIATAAGTPQSIRHLPFQRLGQLLYRGLLRQLFHLLIAGFHNSMAFAQKARELKQFR